MKTVVIAQARMTSSRLPGKVLKPVLGKPLLTYFIERLQHASQVDQIVIATTVNYTDEPIVELCRDLSIPFTRGSEDDVLSRYYDAALVTSAEIIVRVTSDCPLIDPAIVDEAISYFKANKHRFDYVSNSLVQTYPRGMDVEVFSAHILSEAQRNAKTNVQREHVTPFFYTSPERYRIGHIHSSQNLAHHRWTVDTPEDLELITKIIQALYPLKPIFNIAEIIDLLTVHPDWNLINAKIAQKALGQ